MAVYVLDSSAVLRFIDNEPGAERVEEIFTASVRGYSTMQTSALQWGEVAGRLRKRLGDARATQVLEGLMPMELDVISATGERAVRAASLRQELGIPYADCFALELVMDGANRILVTADYDFKAAAHRAQIEFLPIK